MSEPTGIGLQYLYDWEKGTLAGFTNGNEDCGGHKGSRVIFIQERRPERPEASDLHIKSR